MLRFAFPMKLRVRFLFILLIASIRQASHQRLSFTPLLRLLAVTLHWMQLLLHDAPCSLIIGSFRPPILQSIFYWSSGFPSIPSSPSISGMKHGFRRQKGASFDFKVNDFGTNSLSSVLDPFPITGEGPHLVSFGYYA